MVEISITPGNGLLPSAAPIEIVERKGTGHRDTLCDALAEELSLALCRFYRDRFGLILHHNIDKAVKAAHPAIGEDIKVMGVRQGAAITR